MNKFKFSNRSIVQLNTVDDSLRKVAYRALELSEIDFVVTEGKRTKERQHELYGQGRTASELANKGVPTNYAKPSMKKVTWTLTSNHFSGRAIDIVPWYNGKVEWDENGKLGLWNKLYSAFKKASDELGVKIVWGGNWSTPDRPHFELA